jgi:hypothetical protein
MSDGSQFDPNLARAGTLPASWYTNPTRLPFEWYFADPGQPDTWYNLQDSIAFSDQIQ